MSKKRKNIQSEISAKTDTPKKKNKHKKILIGIFGCLLLMLVAVGLYLFIPRQQEPVATEELVDCPLYWNVDREKYQPKLGGLSTRQPDADGFYTMRFLTRGEIVEYRVKDKELMLTIDSEDAMGLLVDEDGFVTEYVELIDMGVREVASWYYVLRPKEDGAIINTSTVGKGVNIDIKWQDETGFWDVTNKEDYGCATKLELLDAVRVFNNSDGEITDVFVVEREPSLAGLSPDQYCPHCGKVVTWTMWAFLDSFPSGEGHYWVVHDINMKKQYSMPKDTKQCVNLNGKTITATHEKRMVSLHNEGVELAIMDLSEEQTGTLKGKGDGGMGSVVWVRFGQFDLYGGTLDASEVVTYSAGAAVNVFNKDGVFNMHDGTIIGGTVKAIVNEKGNVTNATGGALAVRGTVNMYGGTIRDGKCVTTKDKAGNKGASAGGNVFVYNGGTFNMYDGVISGGTIADNQVAYGGNVRVVPGAVWNMYGGVIENGVSFNKAGNFSLFGTLNMSGGVIRGGKVMTDGESLKDAKVDEDSASKNLHIDSGKLNMTGGTIEGYVNVAGKKSELNISGTAKIAGGKSNLTLPTTNVINMGQLKKGAKIGISGGGFITNETKESNCQYVFSDYGLNVSYEENKMLIGKYACICGEQSGKHFGVMLPGRRGRRPLHSFLSPPPSTTSLQNRPSSGMIAKRKAVYSYGKCLRYSGHEAPAAGAWLSFFQGQGTEFSHRSLGAPVHRHGCRGGRNGRRAGDRSRHRPADPAAVPAGREGLRCGAGYPLKAHPGHHCGRIQQSGDHLGRCAEAGCGCPGAGKIRRTAAHGLRQSALLYYVPHSLRPAGGGLLRFRHRHGAKRGGPAHRRRPRRCRLQRFYRVLPVLRPTGAAV